MALKNMSPSALGHSGEWKSRGRCGKAHTFSREKRRAFTNVALASRKSSNFSRRILAAPKGQEKGNPLPVDF